ncbi:hypothetical protein HU200_046949 [Digitaria exilis]|uniref:Uncharacterized protein n=1 Tax=Digitaria exilis TaxID=1010633 RepID=A0A835B8X1_9POAL|nr:hypothetical protein HU200_046949 [Digitaria exilis]
MWKKKTRWTRVMEAKARLVRTTAPTPVVFQRSWAPWRPPPASDDGAATPGTVGVGMSTANVARRAAKTKPSRVG